MSKPGGCFTPLHYAVQSGNADVIEYLITLPAVDVNARDMFGDTPLLMVAKLGKVKVTLTLATAGSGTRMERLQPRWSRQPAVIP